MSESIFVSYNHKHDSKYKNMLLAWKENKKFDFDFTDHSIDVSVNSNDPNYIKRVISNRIREADYFMCIIGEHTNESDWVKWEIEQFIKIRSECPWILRWLFGKKLLAIKTKKKNATPDVLRDQKASWAMKFSFDAIKKAIDKA